MYPQVEHHLLVIPDLDRSYTLSPFQDPTKNIHMLAIEYRSLNRKYPK